MTEEDEKCAEFKEAYQRLAGAIVDLTGGHSDPIVFGAVVTVAHFLLDHAPDDKKASLVTFLRGELKEYV